MSNVVTNPFKSLTRSGWRKWHSALLAAVICIFAASPALHAQATLTVNTTADELTTNGNCSLREAITNANDDATTFADCSPSGSYGDDTIIFATSTNGTPIVLDIGSSNEDLNADGDLDILDSGGLTITGNGESNTIIDGNDTERVLDHRDGDLTITDLTIQNGMETDGSAAGGGLNSKVDSNAELVVTSCRFTGTTPVKMAARSIRGA